ncbi:MICOS complex subunit MIC13 homolog QIL1 [Anabrus simplex]|uniref:MICOS complex subunit MIC13 homolog QIL1 n=1 Tax=Anabrus simplex TaxID=316456 RepID=UPI0034DD106C
MAFRLIRFGAKVGIAYGVVYYTAQEGIWSGSEGSLQAYKKLYDVAAPYVIESPLKVPDLPKTDQISFLTQHYWNKGVIAAFAFLMQIPDKTVEWSKLGYEMAKEQLQQKDVK